ncbi:septal ring lytic transglycosylase RlpA family protein [Piscinibacter sakaiensis]|uniref:Endolytic peptidoglycan transglycosylase RlpA n=1 Tax=Piscinibacter sakaiensis TaxID=1547922 RepID=A0A0K8P0G0_PISS1|nr:septal ring lytic transglycosylase RlpA family protein [Piscinibacter sakaiensis]GAP36034.1 Rare lipoprotein A precursor [Piscinibacter sakaiensis]
MPRATPGPTRAIDRRRPGALLLLSLLAGCATGVAKPPPSTVNRPQVVTAPAARTTVATRPTAPAGTARTAPPLRTPPGAEPDGPPLEPLGAEHPPDPEPSLEPILAGNSLPYRVGGRAYVPRTEDQAYPERGLASWYGRRFHGRRTASGERYDMNALTAAHPTLPLPSYARVRNPANGREVIVRINDRGPFHPGRIVDLSHAAARKLGVLHGPSVVELERITHDEIRTGAWRRAPAEPLPPGDVLLAAAPTAAAPPAAAAAAIAPLATAAGTTAAVAAATPGADAAAPAASGVEAAVWRVGSAASAASTPAEATSDLLLLPVVTRAGDRAAPLAEPAASSATAPVASVDEAAMAAGFWVQIGAFRLRDGAESFRRRVRAEQDWIAPMLHLQRDAELHRLQAGPYASRDEAQAIAQRLREALALVPVVVERR